MVFFLVRHPLARLLSFPSTQNSLDGLAHGAPLTTLCMCLGSLVNTSALFVCFVCLLLYSDILAVSGLTHSLSFLKRRCLFNASGGDAPSQQSMGISRPFYPWLCQGRRHTGSHDGRGQCKDWIVLRKEKRKGNCLRAFHGLREIGGARGGDHCPFVQAGSCFVELSLIRPLKRPILLKRKAGIGLNELDKAAGRSR